MSATEKFYTPTPRDMFEALGAPEPLTQRLADLSLETVRVLVHNGDEVLVGLRTPGSNPHTSNKYELLGGKIDPEDRKFGGDIVGAIIRAGTRELAEESDIRFAPGDPMILQMYWIPDTPEEGKHRGKLVVEYLLTGGHVDGEPTTSREHHEVGWWHREDVRGNPAFRDGTDQALDLGSTVVDAWALAQSE